MNAEIAITVRHNESINEGHLPVTINNVIIYILVTTNISPIVDIFKVFSFSASGLMEIEFKIQIKPLFSSTVQI